MGLKSFVSIFLLLGLVCSTSVFESTRCYFFGVWGQSERKGASRFPGPIFLTKSDNTKVHVQGNLFLTGDFTLQMYNKTESVTGATNTLLVDSVVDAPLENLIGRRFSIFSMTDSTERYECVVESLKDRTIKYESNYTIIFDNPLFTNLTDITNTAQWMDINVVQWNFQCTTDATPTKDNLYAGELITVHATKNGSTVSANGYVSYDLQDNLTQTPQFGGACPPTPCGNGKVETPDEQCDDGNVNNGDGCSDTCQIEPGFTCTTDEPSACTSVCGDSLIRKDEKCDDGNINAGDGCSPTCVIEAGYNCTGEPSTCALLKTPSTNSNGRSNSVLIFGVIIAVFVLLFLGYIYWTKKRNQNNPLDAPFSEL